MPKPRLPFLHREKTRHNKLIWVVRVGHGPRTRLRAPYGAPAFMQEYREAVEKPRAHGQPRDDEGTFGWLWRLYRASPEWARLSPATKKQRDHLMKLSLELAGNQPLEVWTRKFIIAGRDFRASAPSQATNWVKTLRALFRWAVDAEHLDADPTVNVKLLRQASDGWHTWTADEMARFEARWPTGTRERLAYDVLLWTGLRRGDAARLGPKHVTDGEITVTTEKTGRVVTILMLKPLVDSIAASPVGAVTFIASADGKPMVKTLSATGFPWSAPLLAFRAARTVYAKLLQSSWPRAARPIAKSRRFWATSWPRSTGAARATSGLHRRRSSGWELPSESLTYLFSVPHDEEKPSVARPMVDLVKLP
jgi:hypothetical protein